MAYKSWTEVDEEIKKQQAAQKAADKAANAELHDEQKKQVEDAYKVSVLDTHSSYVPAYNEAAIQKKITEKQIAENMANLGLTDSGLNRDQQTAVQMSYNRQKNTLDNQRRSAVDALTRQLASEVSSILQSKLSADNAIDQSYENFASEQATKIWNTQVEEETKRLADEQDYNLKMTKLALEQAEKDAKAAEAASYLIRTNGGLISAAMTGTFSQNGIDVYQNADGSYVYVDNNSGKKTTLEAGVNPFTGTTNRDVAFGTFSNGYQPNNIGGKKLTKTDVQIDVNGNQQSIWRLGNAYYFWNGRANKYEQLTAEEVTEAGLGVSKLQQDFHNLMSPKRYGV